LIVSSGDHNIQAVDWHLTPRWSAETYSRHPVIILATMKSRNLESANLPSRFYSLDVLRGLAALGIVFWHWSHFFYDGTEPGHFDRVRQPFYLLFKPCYMHGAQAVPLFFCLSGFIFYWLYSDRISRRAISLKEFAVLRFSRLYPLHLLTLLLVAAGQLIMRRYYGSFFVYPNNDLYHFLLQLFFASEWGFQRGISFNGPVWSVSIEILLYSAFFAVCAVNWRRWWHLLMFVLAGHILIRLSPSSPGRALSLFFIGGLSFKVFACLWRRGSSRFVLHCLWVAAILMWILVPLNKKYNLLYWLYQTICGTSLTIAGKDPIGYALTTMSSFSIELLFPVTILTLALTEAHRGTLGKRVAFLGDISYSSYLLHFPLQLLFVLIASVLAIPNTFFYSPASLCLFFLVLIPVSLGSYRLFERPSQTWLRTRLTGRSSHRAPQRASAKPPPSSTK
jgi:peptidoglycan/LPS O-acetylase OafA/YrhL